jgi:hypothetical protein
MCCTVRLECSGGLALASPPFERCTEGNKLNALSLEQKASVATLFKIPALLAIAGGRHESKRAAILAGTQTHALYHRCQET